MAEPSKEQRPAKANALVLQLKRALRHERSNAGTVASLIGGNAPDAGGGLNVDKAVEVVGDDGCYTGEVLAVGLFVLISAAETNNVAAVSLMVDSRVDVNSTTNVDQKTALHFAAQYGSVDAATLLLEKNASLDQQDKGGSTALIWAAATGHAGVVAVLLNAATLLKSGPAVDLNVVNNNGDTALILAIELRNLEIVTLLLNSTGKCGAAVDLNVADREGMTPLMVATSKDHNAIVAALLDATGKDGAAVDLNVVNVHGNTALICAAYKGNAEIVAAQLGAHGRDGAAVDLNVRNKEGNTALMGAAYNSHCTVVTALVGAIGKGGAAADLNLMNNDGSTALTCAASQYHTEIAVALLGVMGKDGVAADINLTSTNGTSPLIAAIISKNVGMVKLLVDRSACVDEVHFECALEHGTDEIVRELERIVGPKKTCAACRGTMHHFKFAKSQMKKSSSDRRCIDCVTEGNVVPNAKAADDVVVLLQCSACAVEKPPNQFSKAQRGKKEARKCTECITHADTMQKEAKAATVATKLLEAEAASIAKSGSAVSPRRNRKKGGGGSSGGSGSGNDGGGGGAKEAGKAYAGRSPQFNALVGPNDVEKLGLGHNRSAQQQQQQQQQQLAAERVDKIGEEQAEEIGGEVARATTIQEAEWQAAEPKPTAAASDLRRGSAAKSLKSSPGVTPATSSNTRTSTMISLSTLIMKPSPSKVRLQAAAASTQPPRASLQSPPPSQHAPPQPEPQPSAPNPSTQALQPPSPSSPSSTSPLASTSSTTLIPTILELDPTCLTASVATVLGSGSFATVIGGTYTFPVHGTTPVAIKVFHGTAGDRVGRSEAAALTELMASTRVSVNPHLVQMYGAARLPGHGLCLVMELIAGQSLRVVLDETAEILPWELRMRWLCEVAQGMDAMHQHKPNPVLHRDLKASNVLLDSRDVGVARAKIADFGVAKAIDTLVVDTYSRGSREWSAPEALLGFMSFPTDVYSFGIVVFEMLTRLLPFSNKSGAEKTRMELLQVECAQFEYDQDIFEEEDVDEEQQRARWVRKRARTLKKRRPDLDLLSAESPTEAVSAAIVVMQACWLDEPADRPSFANVVATLAPFTHSSNSSICGSGGSSGSGGSGSAKQQRAPKVNIYSLCADEFQLASVGLAEEGLSREKASEIFIKGLAGTLERLFKEVVAQHRLSIPDGKAPGLGTYYRTIKDAKGGGGGTGGNAVFDESSVQAMDKFCSQRNQVVHEDVQYSVPTIRQHALTCGKVLDALKSVYAM